MRITGFVGGLCLSTLFWVTPGLEAGTWAQRDWRPLHGGVPVMPPAADRFRPLRQAPPGVPAMGGAMPGWRPIAAAAPYPSTPYPMSYPGRWQARPAPWGAAAYPPPPAYGFPPSPYFAYAYPGASPGYGVLPARAGASYGRAWWVPPSYGAPPPAMPVRVSWSRPEGARFRPTADARSWNAGAAWRPVEAPVQYVRYPGPAWQGGRPAGPMTGAPMAYQPRPPSWGGQPMFRPVAAHADPQTRMRTWQDPRFRPLRERGPVEQVARSARADSPQRLPGWLTTESNGFGGQTPCEYCAGS